MTFHTMKHYLLVFLLFAAVFRAAASEPTRVVFMVGEDQYRTAETLPEFADKDLKPRGYRVTFVHADAGNPNSFPGLEAALRDADILVLSVRRRTPPQAQLDAVRAFLNSGKPLVGIRTACHAFALRPRDKLTDPTLAAWQKFDPEVLGGHYTDHHKGGPTITVTEAPGAGSNPILKGVTAARLAGVGSLYKVSPLKPDTTPLLLGAIPGQPAEPLAWTRLYGAQRARIFFTSLGGPEDFQNTDFRRLLVNGLEWAAKK